MGGPPETPFMSENSFFIRFTLSCWVWSERKVDSNWRRVQKERMDENTIRSGRHGLLDDYIRAAKPLSQSRGSCRNCRLFYKSFGKETILVGCEQLTSQKRIMFSPSEGARSQTRKISKKSANTALWWMSTRFAPFLFDRLQEPSALDG